MNLEDAIKGRRSIRKYNSTPVSGEEIRAMIDAAIWSPTACNRQGWQFIIIDDKDKFDELIKHGAASFLKNVNQAILVLYENITDNTEYKDHIQSASASIQNMILKGYELGVGSCWVNFLPRKAEVRTIFRVPRNYDPIALVSIGHYDKEPTPVKRKQSIDEVISYNSFDTSHSAPKGNMQRVRIKRIFRKLYFLFPFKSLLKPFLKKREKTFDN